VLEQQLNHLQVASHRLGRARSGLREAGMKLSDDFEGAGVAGAD
jgi:hypothetical protein